MEQCRFPVMGTWAHLVVGGPFSPSGYESAVAATRQRLEELERKWSRFLADSELSQINRKAGRPVVVSSETYELVEMAVEAWRETEGRFDPTVRMAEAGYDRSFDRIDPRSKRVTNRVPAPTPERVELAPYASSVTVPEGVTLDLGGIAKGAAADHVVDLLLSTGVTSVCVNIGGDLRVAGPPPRPEGWLVDLECPGSDRSVVVGIAEGAVCTSTTRRRRWRGSDGDEHHLRDPATGHPMENGLASVVVIGARAVQAEILSKSVFGLRPDGAADELLARGATGLLVTDDGALVPLPGFEAFEAAGRPVTEAA